MGSLNIAEWSPDQVAEWMSGLGPKVAQYVPELHKKGLNGAKLLTLRCDDLEYLGIHVIGHQELLLEAVEHLRNFHYELSRECVQQLALRVSSAAASLARALRHHADARLETHSLADVARTVHAVKPLVCWLDRWPLCSGSPLAERKAALLKLSLEAATCAQRDRFAEQPARAVAAAAAAVAAVADYIIQDVSDPTILQPASLDCVCLRQGERALGFEVVPSFCGHHQLAHIRFASPAHASGLVHEADEIVQVGGKCVIGWSGEAVERACAAAARAGGELQLRLRRRGARALPALPTPPLRAPRRAPRPPPLLAQLRLHRCAADAPSWYEKIFYSYGNNISAVAFQVRVGVSPRGGPGGPGRAALARRVLVRRQRGALAARLAHAAPRQRSPVSSQAGGGAGPAPLGVRRLPRDSRPPLAVQQFWRELQQQRWVHGGSPEPDDATLYRRDKAASCGAGLQLSPRPRTCPAPPGRGKLDKSHSTPAYDFEPPAAPPALAAQPIPESPTTPPPAPAPAPPLAKAGQILDFKKSSSRLEEAIQQRSRRAADDAAPAEAVNAALAARARHSDDASSDDQVPIPVRYPKPRIVERYGPSDAPPEPPPRPPPREVPARSPAAPGREPPVPGRELAVLGRESSVPGREPAAAGIVVGAGAAGGAGVRGMFARKKGSLLGRRRAVAARWLAARGAAGRVWQRVRGAARARWAARHLLLAHNLLYAFRSADCERAACMIHLDGFTVCAAGEVKSRAFAFKVYHTGTAFYFACDSRDAMLAWIQLIHRATLLPAPPASAMDLSKQFSETDYSETESDTENSDRRNERERERERDREKEKSKFGSLKKLTHRGARSESQENVGQAATSLDRKYLRFFSRARKDEPKGKGKAPAPGEHYRSYRRAPAPPALHYIHASNPNLLDFEKSDLVVKPDVPLPKPKPPGADKFVGFVTLEQFMLRKQEEERRGELQRRLDRVVPDVVYGELGHGYEEIACGAPRDGERRVEPRPRRLHTEAPPTPPTQAPSESAPTGGVSRLRLMFGARRELQRQESSRSEQYPHLQCPPTFQPESYSLARPPPPPARD